MHNKRISRVLDANLNRLKEALRVVEDVFRFILEDDNLRKKSRRLRHSLDVLVKDKLFKKAILERDSVRDLGKKTDIYEFDRRNSLDILFINLQRAKESLRVLEEFSKIIAPKKTTIIKKMRYDIYDLEKNAYISKGK